MWTENVPAEEKHRQKFNRKYCWCMKTQFWGIIISDGYGKVFRCSPPLLGLHLDTSSLVFALRLVFNIRTKMHEAKKEFVTNCVLNALPNEGVGRMVKALYHWKDEEEVSVCK